VGVHCPQALASMVVTGVEHASAGGILRCTTSVFSSGGDTTTTPTTLMSSAGPGPVPNGLTTVLVGASLIHGCTVMFPYDN
jgi:hypothetical protein